MDETSLIIREGGAPASGHFQAYQQRTQLQRSQQPRFNFWRKIWQRLPCRPAWLPLSNQATSLFLSTVTDTSVMALVTLATFSATYLLAWGKPGTSCIPKLFKSTVSDGKDLENPGLSGQQIFIGLLPFAIFPIAVYLSGLAKIAEKDERALGFVAGSCLCELIFGIVLGAVMTCCMAAADWKPVAIVSFILIILMTLIWSLTFKYPKFLSIRRGEVDAPEDRQ